MLTVYGVIVSATRSTFSVQPNGSRPRRGVRIAFIVMGSLPFVVMLVSGGLK